MLRSDYPEALKLPLSGIEKLSELTSELLIVFAYSWGIGVCKRLEKGKNTNNPYKWPAKHWLMSVCSAQGSVRSKWSQKQAFSSLSFCLLGCLGLVLFVCLGWGLFWRGVICLGLFLVVVSLFLHVFFQQFAGFEVVHAITSLACRTGLLGRGLKYLLLEPLCRLLSCRTIGFVSKISIY